jgi:signal transduction histidine kinase
VNLQRPTSVLVVDDDAAIRNALHEVLSSAGYEVELAENGARAMKTMRSSTPPDVVVLDLMMPVMSGWEVLLATDEDIVMRTIPIVVASAMAAPVASPDRRGGVRKCLAKPLDIELLLDTLGRVTAPLRSEAAVSPPLSVRVPQATSAVETLRVLVVEDSPDDADLVLLELRRAGHDVAAERVATADEYEAALDRQAWDVILSDFSMPGFSGRAALDTLRARSLDIPFIIVSGTLGESVAVEVMKAGAHDFFAKGNLTRLGSAIEREVREAARRRDQIAETRRVGAELERTLSDLRCAVKVRDDFLSIASHELKTPLTSLLLEVQLLQRLLKRGMPQETPDLETRVHGIARQVTRLTKLTDALLDVSSLTTGKMILSRETVDLREVLDAVLVRSEELIRQSGSTVSVRSESVQGSWDRIRVESVVTNLILNAVKYGEGKPIEIELDGPGERARLVVRDHGIGIPSEEQARIFEKFERAVPLRHYGGFGLGLWIARQVILAHGGQIRCESQLGRGSTFTVDVPRLPDAMP